METPLKLGEEIQVNTTTLDSQTDPDIARLEDGRYVVVWDSRSDDIDSSIGVYGQVFSQSGQKIGSEFLINSETANNQNAPKIAPLLDGGFVVHWVSRDQDGDSFGIFGQRFDSNADPFLAEFQVNTTTDGAQDQHVLAAHPNGGWIAAWGSRGQDNAPNQDYGVFAVIYDDDGNEDLPEFQVNDPIVGDQNINSILPLADGGFWIFYTSPLSGTEIAAQRYNASGTAVGNTIVVNSGTAGNQSGAQAVVLANGDIIVTFGTQNLDGDDTGVAVKRFVAGATTGDPEVQVNTFTVGAQSPEHIAATPDGGFIIIWRSKGQDEPLDPANNNIYLQRYDSAGEKVGTEFLVNTVDSGSQSNARMAMAPDGGFMVTWQTSFENGVDGNFGINAQRFAAQHFGTSDADDIEDDAGANWMNGRGGDDILRGLDGNDTLFGDAGEDTISGGVGNDKLFGGAEDDELSGDAGKDKAYGGVGDDSANGGGGKDSLFGQADNDILNGNAGRDRLDGGSGNDLLNGGGGRDNLVFKKNYDKDVVAGFKNNQDTILFSKKLKIGSMDAEDFVRKFAKDTGNHIVFKFGNGDTLKILNVKNKSMLFDDVGFI